jgi:hypothetical protein
MAVKPTRSAKSTLTTRRSSVRPTTMAFPQKGQNRAASGTGRPHEGQLIAGKCTAGEAPDRT